MDIRFCFCRICKHYRNDKTFTCTAFPDGIPKKILYAREFHFKNFHGDGGIKFEVIPEKENFLEFADME
ncbi:hypothetical protein [Solidesulfovibrio magneticus]|uniref:hypothetical protein n=1 Tax=Solidesulfovibrio magneticus TaxID=184917 RepID=UPI0011D13BC1|nr:hypothetical protein [Solidesulfovibrio magneticus]